VTELEGRAHAALQSSGIKLGVDESRCGRAHAHSRLRVAEQVHDGGKKLVIVAGIYDQSVMAVRDDFFRRAVNSDAWC
jgi:hypothetical protein